MKIRFGLIVQNLDAAVSVAEKEGLDSLWLLDHFLSVSHIIASLLPETSSSALAYLPLALSRSRCTVGTSVLCPLFRFHPAVIGQYFAQLDRLYPNRVILGIGAGEASVEAPLFGRWPSYKERRERLIEAVQIIRRLWTSNDFFDYDGRYYKMHNVYLYLKPRGRIPIVISARGSKSAKLAGELGDGIIIHAAQPEALKNEILPIFIEAAKKAGKDPETLIKAHFFFFGLATDPVKVVSQLRSALAYPHYPKAINESDPRKIDEMAKEMPTEEELLKVYPICTNIDELIGHIEAYIQAGVNEFIVDDLTTLSESLGLDPAGADKRWERILTYFR